MGTGVETYPVVIQLKMENYQLLITLVPLFPLAYWHIIPIGTLAHHQIIKSSNHQISKSSNQ